jgi:transposase-like protein
MKSFSQLMALTEDEARETLEKIRWPQGPVCPHCLKKNVTALQGKATRPGVYKCRDCRKQFTVTVGTIFHKSHIPLKTWLIAFHLLCSSKKGISALQLQRMLNLKSYQTAWHMAHRIRHAMSSPPLAAMLTGDVEVDEVAVGGYIKGSEGGKRKTWTNKTQVVALVSRDGPARAFPLDWAGAKNLKDTIRWNVDRSSRILTDKNQSYYGLSSEFAAHETVNHSKNEYVRGDVSTNTVESYFALLRRGIHGTFHSISRKHLKRYCDEFSFRWTWRKVDDTERTFRALRKVEGKRLTKKGLVA